MIFPLTSVVFIIVCATMLQLRPTFVMIEWLVTREIWTCHAGYSYRIRFSSYPHLSIILFSFYFRSFEDEVG